jgi:DNA mismatch repair protein MLH1
LCWGAGVVLTALSGQTLLPGAIPVDGTPKASRTKSNNSDKTATNGSAGPSSSTARKVAPKSLVRTDHNTQTLDSMFVPVPFPIPTDDDADEQDRPSKRRKSDHDYDVSSQLANESQQAVRAKIAQSETDLTSVIELRKEVVERCDAGAWFVASDMGERVADGGERRTGLEAIVKGHIFVGVADLQGSLSMLQHRTKLYLVNHASLS